MTPEEARRRVADVPFWYRTIDVAPGVETPGYFDLRPVVDRIPWPDLKGKRCLDIATYDGFFAFEMEKRGAAEVVAVDLPDSMDRDWTVQQRHKAQAKLDLFHIPPAGTGFRAASEVLGSKVKWLPRSVYDLDPDDVGTFDVVFLGSLLIHLRDPLRALMAARSVVGGLFISSDQIELDLTLMSPRKPMFSLNDSPSVDQWFNFNAAGHRKLLEAAGFEILTAGRPYTDRLNRHPQPGNGPRQLARRAGLLVLTGSTQPGVLHRGLLARTRR